MFLLDLSPLLNVDHWWSMPYVLWLYGLWSWLEWCHCIWVVFYFESWLSNSRSCLLFTVSSVGEKSVFLLYVTVLFLIPGIWWEISSEYQFQIVFPCLVVCHIWWNFGTILKSAILSWSAIIPNAVIGDPSAVFNFVMVACIGVLKLLSIVW